MKSLLDLLLSNYFVIDSEKEEIYGLEETGEAAPGEESPRNQDLLSAIGDMMLENQRLQEIRLELQKRERSPEEMEDFLKKMITFLDSFERILNLARRHPPSEEIDNWLKSVETIYFRLFHILEKYGLKPLDSVGNPVNLDYHDVVEYRPTLDHDPDTVIAERQKGYLFNGKLLRDAKVVVAYNPSAG